MLTRSAGEHLAGGFSAFDFASRKTVIAAVSGGSDSLGLLLLLKAHLQRDAPATRLAAVTVDHGLREESASEAEQVSAFCAARGIGHRTLRWEGEKPRTGLSATAREARYRLLAKAAADAGTDIVLTGHMLDDQAETVSMRKDRGEGRGLAGMAPATLYDGRIWIVRPLLGIGREALRIFLRREGVEWAEDPSNADPAYERVRARQAIASGPETLSRALLDMSSAAATARIQLGECATSLIRSCASQVASGLIRLDRNCFLAQPRPVSLHALRLLLATIGGRDHLPEETSAVALLQKLQHGPCRGTLSGAVLDARRTGIFLHREFRSGGLAPIPAADGAIWDGRFCIAANGHDLDGPLVAPLGRARAAEAVVPDDAAAPASLIRAALAAEPVLSPSPSRLRLDTSPPFHGSEELRHRQLAFPRPRLRGRGVREADGEGVNIGLSSATLTPLVPPYARFLPSFDLAPAQALADLLGAPPFPPPPFADHIAA